METEDQKARDKIQLTIEASELIRKWANVKFKVPLGSYYEDGLARVQDLNGLHKLEVISKNVEERKAFVNRGKPGAPQPPKHSPVRSATGKARRPRMNN